MRLIDADALKTALAEMWYERNISITGLSVAELIDEAPTIEPRKSRPFGDCAKCIHIYGTLGCCTTVNNEWVYDCEYGMEQYKETKAEPSGDLISRQSAISIPFLPKEHRRYQTMNLDDAYERGWCDLEACIQSLPSADTVSRSQYQGLLNAIGKVYVEVVRCEDCRHYSVEGITTLFGWCNALEMPTDEQRFCSDGERREQCD